MNGNEKSLGATMTDEKVDELSWIDWILTETDRVTVVTEQDRGKKRELSAESESREDILLALTREINEDEERSETQQTSTR